MTTYLPNADDAVAAERKFTRYLLDPRRRPDLARLFRGLGYTRANWRDLRQRLLQEVLVTPARPGRRTIGGMNWVVDIAFEFPDGSPVHIRTIWFVPDDVGGHPHFTTAYPARQAGRR